MAIIWVAYAVAAVVSAVGENKLMPLPDCACKVINGKKGYVRANCSWIIARIMRNFEGWMDGGDTNVHIHICVRNIINEKAKDNIKIAGKSVSELSKEKPSQAGLCVSAYKAE